MSLFYTFFYLIRNLSDVIHSGVFPTLVWVRSHLTLENKPRRRSKWFHHNLLYFISSDTLTFNVIFHAQLDAVNKPHTEPCVCVCVCACVSPGYIISLRIHTVTSITGASLCVSARPESLPSQTVILQWNCLMPPGLSFIQATCTLQESLW